MDMKVNKKLGLKERYSLMTRDLAWTPTYQAVKDVFPYTEYEGIKSTTGTSSKTPFA